MSFRVGIQVVRGFIRIAILLVTASTAFMLCSCARNGPLEKVGEKMDHPEKETRQIKEIIENSMDD